MRVLRNAVSSVFGCRHGRLSRLFTIQRQSYMVCLDCGHKVFYSPAEMRRLSRREVRSLGVVDPRLLPVKPATEAVPARPGAAA